MRVTRNRLLLPLIAIVMIASAVFCSPPTAFADNFNWQNVNGQNWLTSVKDQGNTGCCWDFSAMGSLEAKYMLTRNDFTFQPDLSEQNALCAGIGTVNGGYAGPVHAYAVSTGIVSETELPFTAQNTSPLWPLQSGWQNRVWKAVSYVNNNQNDTTANLKAWLQQYGPLSVGLNADVSLFSSVLDVEQNYRAPSGSANHEVDLVGFQDDPKVSSGGYWIIKNSWNSGWGNNGYGYIPYGSLEYYNDTSYLNKGVYYTGPMYHTGGVGGSDYTGTAATALWTGTTNGTWDTSTANNWKIGSSAFTWLNQEVQANFDSTGSSKTITINGTAIAHGLSFASGGTGYTISGGSLTVTAGGIAANESVTINSPITVGAPQTWTVASGKTLTVGAVHTVISDLTISGAGNTTISGALDGGGVINTTGAAPGNLIFNGSGVLQLAGAANYSGNIAANSGVTQFWPASGVTATYSGVVSGGAWIDIHGGTTIFPGNNTYTNATTIYSGALQADVGHGLPSGSFLKLNGGVLQSNSAGTFTRSLGTSGSKFQWMSASGGGFSAGAGALTVNVGNGSSLTWGTTVGSQIVGPLMFESPTAANVVTFKNAVNLNAASRTVFVDDNVNSSADYAVMSGVLSNSTGTAGLVKTGAGMLQLTAANTYNGSTTISGGALQANLGAGIPSASFLSLDGGVLQSNSAVTFNRSLGTSGSAFQLTANGGGFSAGGGAMTVNIGNGSALTWGTTVGTNIVGTLKLSSASAANVTTFQNAVNLNGANRTVQVDDNLGTTGDWATMSGVISNGTGTAGLVKAGTGLLLLTGANTYNGATTISAGTLDADIGAGVPTSSFLSFDGGVMQFYSTSSFTRSLGTSGSAFQWTANGGGFSAGGSALTVNVGGASGSLTWGTTVGSQIVGTLRLNLPNSGNVVTFQNPVNLNGADRAIDAEGAGANYAIMSGVISNGTGTAGLFKIGAGTLELTAVNTYTGATTVSAGTLDLGNQNALQSSTVYLNGGSLAFDSSVSGHAFAIGALSGSSNLTLKDTAGNAVTLTAGGNNVSTTFSGSLNNPGTLIKTGAGILTLAGTTDNGGFGATVNAGTLVLGKASNSGVHAIGGATLTVNNGGTAQLGGSGNYQLYDWAAVVVNSGGVFDTNGRSENNFGSLTLAGSGIGGAGALVNSAAGSSFLYPVQGGITLAGDATIGVTQASGALTLEYPVSGGYNLTKVGAGILHLPAANTFTGSTTVSAGTLELDNANALQNSPLVVNGGTVNFEPYGGNSAYSVPSISGSGTINISGSLSTGGNNASTTFSGSINSGPLVKNGTGTFTLAGSADDGGLAAIVNAGTLVLGKASNGNAHSIGGGGLVVNNGGTAQLGGSGNYQFYDWASVVVNSGGAFDTNGLSENSFYSLSLAGAGIGGAGALVNSATGSSSLSPWGSGVTLTADTTIGVTQAGGSLAIQYPITGACNLTKVGAGVLSFAGANTYSGATTVSAGTLQLAAAGALGSTSGVTVNSGAVLDLNGQTSSSSPALTVNGTGIGGAGALINSSSTAASFAGAIGGTFTVGGAGNITLSGPIGTWNTMTKVGNNTVTLSGGNDNGGLSLAVNAGTVVLAKSVNYAVGADSTVNGGLLQIGNASVRQIYEYRNINVTSGAFDINGSSNESFAGLSLAGTGINNAGALVNSAAASATVSPWSTGVTLTNNASIGVTQASGALTVGSVISGGYGLTKVGAGQLTLTAANTYSGATTVNGGLLAATSTGVPGAITVNSGGAFSPGNGVGLTTTGAATWNNGGKYYFEIDSATGSAGSAWDLWSITGNLSASSTFTISAVTESSNGILGQMANFNNANSYQWLLASTSGTMPSNLVSLLTLDGSGFQNALGSTGHIYLSESSDDTSLYLNYSPTGGNGHAFLASAVSPVPEPGALALLAAGLVGLLAYAWRKRQ